jgi:hypothetical protein
MNNLEQLAIVLYTHDSYTDVFNIALSLHETYSKGIEIIILSNKTMSENYINVLYNDKMTYPQRLAHCLNKLPSQFKYVILSHDWAFMYNFIDLNKIETLILLMNKNNIDQIRLLNASCGTNCLEIEKNVYSISDDGLLFSLQPTLWNASILKKIGNDNQQYVYRNIELGIQDYMRQFNNCFYYEGESRFNGAGHCKSNIYPHIHSLRNGKWIIRENENYIIDIINKFNIDIPLRGIHN